MKQHKIIIDKEGNIKQIHNDRLPATVFGKMKQERASDIIFSESYQKWYIKILVGPKKDTILCDGHNDILFFDSYEEAREYEVEFFNNEYLVQC